MLDRSQMMTQMHRDTLVLQVGGLGVIPTLPHKTVCREDLKDALDGTDNLAVRKRIRFLTHERFKQFKTAFPVTRVQA